MKSTVVDESLSTNTTTDLFQRKTTLLLDQTLLTASTDLKKFINRYTNHKEIFDLQQRHDNMELNTNKNFFSDNYIMDIFTFISAIISLLATTLTVYLLCKNKKL